MISIFEGSKKREFTKKEALKMLADVFHKTRLTEKVYVDPQIIHAVLYGDES